MLWLNGRQGGTTEEPVSLIAADDPVTCAVYAKKHGLLNLPGWKRFKHLAKSQKSLPNQSHQPIKKVDKSEDLPPINLVLSYLQIINMHWN